MGASISMASGARHAGKRPVLCAIGDSTFTHSGMTPLLDAARENTDIKVFILDNSIVAMTGGQPTMASEEDMVRLIEGLGVPRAHIRPLVPLPKNHDENVRIIREELEYHGLSVLLATRACVTYAKAIKEQRKAAHPEGA
jgi:indolepyruvate ferredoxin oxidoreductase alpha subunit